MKPTLLVLAAGMGSRYGALKQMDGVGPNNEAILDYSIYDAKRAGFGKVVFVIREDFAEAFKKVNNTEKFGIQVEYVYQSLDKLPEGFSVPEGRVKPWGTCHAVLMAKDVIHEPFAAINADDFYGKEAYEVLAKYLMECEGKTGAYSMVAYKLRNTMSDFGTVSRGICTADAEGNLQTIVERTAIGHTEDGGAAEGLCRVPERSRPDQHQGRVLHPVDGEPKHPRRISQAESAVEQCLMVRRYL